MCTIVNLADKFSQISDFWNPRIAGELNGQQVKLTRLKGDFIWHTHENEDELFLVVRGTLHIELRDRRLTIQEGEFVIIPRGVEHRPFADEAVDVLLFEPASTINTGDQPGRLTRNDLDRI